MLRTVEHSEIETYGIHIMLDGYDTDPVILANRHGLYRQLAMLPEELGMKIIAAPLVVDTGAKDGNDLGGLSGFVLMSESHISVHTFPDTRSITIDLYARGPVFDHDLASARLKSAFRIGEADTYIQPRGHRHPRYLIGAAAARRAKLRSG